jgi:hypothetical protein
MFCLYNVKFSEAKFCIYDQHIDNIIYDKIIETDDISIILIKLFNKELNSKYIELIEELKIFEWNIDIIKSKTTDYHRVILDCELTKIDSEVFKIHYYLSKGEGEIPKFLIIEKFDYVPKILFMDV